MKEITQTTGMLSSASLGNKQMLNHNRKHKALSLLAGFALIGSMPVASMPAKQIMHSVIVQEINSTSAKTQVEDISGFQWDYDATTGDEFIHR